MEYKAEIQQIEQLARALNLALKHSSFESRTALNRMGFTKNQRIILQRISYLLVKACRATLARLA